MKKTFKYYALIWAILFVVFNAVVFLVRPVIPGYEINYDGRFWVAWVFIVAAFAGNLFCAYQAFKTENLQKLFYKLSLIRVSYTGLILMVIFGVILMLIPDCPAWITAIICILILAFTAVAVVKAQIASDAVEKVDEKVKVKTLFIKSLTVDADTLMAGANTPEIKEECRKVFEAIRYSDPMSSDALANEEGQITLKFAELSDAVKKDDLEGVQKLAKEVMILVESRNKKCKLLK